MGLTLPGVRGEGNAAEQHRWQRTRGALLASGDSPLRISSVLPDLQVFDSEGIGLGNRVLLGAHLAT